MRPAAPSPVIRRQAAVAIFFAAWCAVYGLPADLARNLTVQTAGLSQLSVGKPAKQARVLLDRISNQVRRSEQARLHFFSALIATPVRTTAPLAAQAFFAPSPTTFHLLNNSSSVLFERPPPVSFLS